MKPSTYKRRTALHRARVLASGKDAAWADYTVAREAVRVASWEVRAVREVAGSDDAQATYRELVRAWNRCRAARAEMERRYAHFRSIPSVEWR